LTKILVVVLSLFSIFLCGMVVSYVGSANNYKGLYDKLKTENQSLQSQAKQVQSLYSEQVKKTELLEEKLGMEIKSLQERNNQLAADLQKTDRLSQEYQSRSESWKGVMTGFEQSVAAMLDSLKMTQDQLEKSRSQNIKDQKELNQITADLYEKIVELQRLESERRRLLEQKTTLEKQLSQGNQNSAPTAVTQVIDAAKQVATPVSSSIKGLIMEIDQSLVTLSVGSADGVTRGTVFHVTRGSDFLCDVTVTDVDINKSAGVLEMVQQQPKIGDVVSTKL
jgi:chromosome segregation ATPase